MSYLGSGLFSLPFFFVFVFHFSCVLRIPGDSNTCKIRLKTDVIT